MFIVDKRELIGNLGLHLSESWIIHITHTHKIFYEAAIINQFKRHSSEYLSPSEHRFLGSIISILNLMQHYGAPTRLIDWTFSPWVAAYFACSSYFKDDGAIWLFNRDSLSRTLGEKYIQLTESGGDVNEQERAIGESQAQLIAMAKAERIEEWAKSAGLNRKTTVSTHMYELSNPRISAQQSLFTISNSLETNHDEGIDEILSNDCDKQIIVIKKGMKHKLLTLLWGMNINPLSLFPSIDGVGRFVKDTIAAQLPIDDGGLGWISRETNDFRDIVGENF